MAVAASSSPSSISLNLIRPNSSNSPSIDFNGSRASISPFPKRLRNSRFSIPSPPAAAAAAAAAAVDSPLKDHDRVFNFAAGPATLPETVLNKAKSEICNWRTSGMSVMEMSHRGREFLSIIQKAESDLRSLLSIPEEFDVLFLQGGATTQFSAIPLNLCPNIEAPVDFLVTGSWGDKAFKEAQKYCSPRVIWSGKSENYTRIPSFGELNQNPDAKYLHICSNETIHGVEFKNYPLPLNKSGLLVADMSSNFCSKPVDVAKFGLIYAGVQKNVGPSGVTIVIVRRDLIGNCQQITPIMMDYKTQRDNNSLYNTPPCYGIYMCGLIFEHLLDEGGLVEVEKRNAEKAGLLYEAIDCSLGFYKCPVEKGVRSVMNVPFTLERSDLGSDFIKEAEGEKMVQLKGHRSVGGIRASIYNAMPLAGVQKLVAFMKDFQLRHP